ncbi:Chaperone-modulator protein CbpM [Coxiella-like endosymbiont]|uniref:chaperone modulator CbpM n=1 Tax=Coxiella-like endosymbiont TaxID=1592897 RepID=UPI000C805BF4|nr:chaperone modulator CbpM [Coxiella-like endosymbiont]PMB54665.1 Chaperone-modulator protein CbpM [Coxiella-like endosymbiont]
MSKQILKNIIVEQFTSWLNLKELCQAVHLQAQVVIEMVEHQLIEPEGNTPNSWRFDNGCLKRAKIAASFYHDLEVNIPGIGIALDLLERIEYLEQRLQTLKCFEKK